MDFSHQLQESIETYVIAILFDHEHETPIEDSTIVNPLLCLWKENGVIFLLPMVHNLVQSTNLENIYIWHLKKHKVFSITSFNVDVINNITNNYFLLNLLFANSFIYTIAIVKN